MTIHHFSASQLLTYEMCGELYRLRYMEGKKFPRNDSLLRGSSVHRSRHQSLRWRLDEGELPQIEEVKDFSATFTRQVLEEGEIVTGEGQSVQALKDDVKDSAIRLAVCDRTELQPDIVPEAIERKMVLEITGLPRIIAYSDVDDANDIVHDLKTGGRKSSFPKGTADSSEQLTLYTLVLADSKSLLAPIGARLEKVRDLKTGPVAGVQETWRGNDHWQAILNRFATMMKAVEAGVFMPASEAHWKCSQAYCEAWHDCPYVARPVSVAV